MDRQPVVAGQFYPAQAATLDKLVRGYLQAAASQGERMTRLVMAPHAGYVYSGAVAGRTLGQARLPQRVVLLGPNHTGRGAPLAIWPQGRWQVPGGGLEVDAELAGQLLREVPGATADTVAHDHEHSLEVLVPFLRALNPTLAIVPIAVAERQLDRLLAAGTALAKVLARQPDLVGLVVSSDMSHYLGQERTKAQDSLALQAILDLDPTGLHEVVRRQGISMCGALPMTLALQAALELGASQANLVAYATSGDVSGDYGRVVGYAGILVD